MEFSFRYKGHSRVEGGADGTEMSFAPDTRREPTFFGGALSPARGVAFREAIGALHDVVISDLRFKPKDKTAYKEWAAQRDQIDWQLAAALREDVRQKITALQVELNQLNQRASQRWNAYYQAQQRYFTYLYQNDRSAWSALDPVVTVHPDEIFFECFSQDESSYGRLGAGYEVFSALEDRQCGTTNVDYSAALYDEFQKIRSYKTTRLQVDPGGFDVATTAEEAYREIKIDLPDGWVRGFLQVSSAMALPATTFELHPMDIHNLCLALRRHKEKQGPRSLRYKLTPGAPVRVVLDPWGLEVPCPRSIYAGAEATEVRVWGRRRLLILERLIPVARRFTVHLLGTGLPSFYVADLGDMSFTLGLSGWTTNDWASAGNFDLLAPRADVDDFTKRRVFDALRRHQRARADALAAELQLDRAAVLGALSAYTQAGRAIFDLHQGVYRLRELSREPLPMDKLRFSSPREESAARLLVGRHVNVTGTRATPAGGLSLSGRVKDRDKRYEPVLTVDGDERIIQAECSCNFYQQNKLYKGPCEHILALRAAHRQGSGR